MSNANYNRHINVIVGVNNITKNVIDSSPTLVYLLENFYGDIEINLNHNGAYYKPSEKKIVLGANYVNLPTLAHELGHATGSYQAKGVDEYVNAAAYANACHTGEGEAIFYEIKVAKELNTSTPYTKYDNTSMWRDLSPTITQENITTTINNLMNNFSGEELFIKLGELNQDMIPSGQSGTQLTYNELDKIFYLVTKKELGNLAEDYKEVTLKDLYGVNADNKFEVYQPEEVKSLVNKSHQHFDANQDNAVDILKNTQVGGSVIAQTYNTYDLLYGGKNIDQITGNSGKEIILGGEGGDTVIGMDGDDIVAGNADNDFVYSGNIEGNNDAGTTNKLIGGTGQDYLQGALGEDVLLNGKGDFSDDNDADYLAGGKGYDTYYVGNNDVIFDEDDKGVVYVSDTTSNKLQLTSLGGAHQIMLTGGTLDKTKYPDEEVYIDETENIEYRLNGLTLTVTLVNDNKTITIENYEKDKDSLGIRLNDAPGKDNVFIIDITGSMGNNVALVKKNAIALISKLFTSEDGKNLATNVGILTYQNNAITWLDKNADTPEKAIAAINRIGSVSGGIELVANSLYRGLLRFPWREGSAVSKQIWLYGDEPGDDLGGLEEVYETSHQLKVKLDGATEGIKEYIPIHTISLHKDSDTTFKEIADRTGGVFFRHGADTSTALQDLANFGSNGDDKITGTQADNVINGQAGNDHLSGGLGSDTYLQTGKFGHDTVQETNPNNQDKNKIEFVDSSIRDYIFSHQDGNLVVSNGNSSVTVNDFYGSENKVNQFLFKDMTLNHSMASFFGEYQQGKKVVYAEDNSTYKSGLFSGKQFIVAGDECVVVGSGAEDAVMANGRDMNVNTGIGEDKIYINGSGFFNAGSGNDIYYIGEDSESVTIHDAIGITDRLVFTDLSLEDVFITQSGRDLQIRSLEDSNQIITVKEGFGLLHRIEEIIFSDKQVLHHSNLKKASDAYKDYAYDEVASNAQLVEQIVDTLQQNGIIYS